MKILPSGAKIRLRCRICGETHEFKFADARVDDKAPARRR